VAISITKDEIPHGACPERNKEILRFAQNDSEQRARNDNSKGFIHINRSI
jgi:hypothetical protein